MVTGYVIRKNEYYDSVFLLRVAQRLSAQKGILQVAALMGTEKNKVLLEEIDVRDPGISEATPSDLIIAVKADSHEALAFVIENLDPWLNPVQGLGGTWAIRTLEEAAAAQSRSNLVVSSVPGSYAAREARKALEHGLNGV